MWCRVLAWPRSWVDRLITSNTALSARFNYAVARQLAAIGRVPRLRIGSGYNSKPDNAPARGSVAICPPCVLDQRSLKATRPNHFRISRMLSPVSSVGVTPLSWTLCGAVLLFVLPMIPMPEALQHTEEGLELLFRERSQSDWENVWHQETHSRCRDKLVRQLYWACEKDIYRLTRRNKKRTGNDESWIKKTSKDPNGSTWLHVNFANMFLRSRRSDAPSITNECCSKPGCTWEEYAEYCPSNKRRNHY